MKPIMTSLTQWPNILEPPGPFEKKKAFFNNTCYNASHKKKKIKYLRSCIHAHFNKLYNDLANFDILVDSKHKLKSILFKPQLL